MFDKEILAISSASSISELEDLRVAVLGKSGALTLALRGLSSIADPKEKKLLGGELNSARVTIERALTNKKKQLEADEVNRLLENGSVDITLPQRETRIGSIHIISKTIQEVVSIFSSMGFEPRFGPEIEDVFYVFDALNTPELHPARNVNDTFYLSSSSTKILRTHTSSVQVRVMLSEHPPIKALSMGRVYRNDWDSTHTPMFHQMELLCIDSGISIGHLKFCISFFLKAFFGSDIEFRFRSSFFPFTEPSIEVDVKMNGEWLEILGCGIVHCNVLRNMNIDSSIYSGFAAGIGMERLAMLKYRLNDIRMFYGADVSFLNFYGRLFA